MATTVADTASGPIMPVSSVLMPSMMVMPLAGVKNDGYLSPRLSPLSLMISLKKKQKAK